MTRFKLTIEYDGTGLCGWQKQVDLPSVQSILETAVHKFCQESLEITGSGRTDAGVHATGQVAHIDITKDCTPHQVQSALNFHLINQPVSIVHAEIVGPDFHARFSATKRSCLYRILNRKARPALDISRVWHIPTPLNIENMQYAANSILGHHDFTSYRSSICQAKSPLKTLDKLDIKQVGDEIHIIGEARSFLHHQMRNMAGSLKLVGTGKWPVNAMRAALDARDRSAAGPTAPPQGLYLTHVSYA